MEISAVELRCPVTALALCTLEGQGQGQELLLAGAGPTVRIYGLGGGAAGQGQGQGQGGQGQALCSMQALEADRVHGLRPILIAGQLRVLVFGTFSATIIAIDEDPTDSSLSCRAALTLGAVPMDMILDGVAVGDTLILGHAQNFLSMYDLRTGLCCGQLRSSMVCVLFSLCFGRVRADGSLPIASGTALGDIHLWYYTPAGTGAEDEGTAVVAAARGRGVEPAVTLKGHEGVVCKMCWAADGARLASVSDDRTVRLWAADSGAALLVGWGHLCRVWDVAFHGPAERELITCGEDLAVKLWAGAGPGAGACLRTLEGHVGRNVWCIAYSAARRCVFSGGNDASIKVWPLEALAALSFDPPPRLDAKSAKKGAAGAKAGAGAGVVACPQPPPASAVDMSGVLRGELCAALKLTADARELYLVTQTGRVVALRLEHGGPPALPPALPPVPGAPAAPEGSGRGLFSGFSGAWEMELRSGSPVHAADLFTGVLRGQCLGLLLCGHVDGSASLAAFRRGEGGLLAQTCWRAHKWRTIGLWILAVEAGGSSGGGYVLGLTATVGGEVKLWRISLELAATAPAGAGADGEVTSGVTMDAPVCVWAGVAGGRQVASCATLLSRAAGGGGEGEGGGGSHGGGVLLGGSKGAVSFFSAALCSNSSSSSSSGSSGSGGGLLPPTHCIAHAHGLEKVCSLREVRGGFVSCGNNGSICVHAYTGGGGAGTGTGTGGGGSALGFAVCSQLDAGLISCPEVLFWGAPARDGGARLGDRAPLFAGGFQGSVYRVWDIRGRYELLKVEAGGWKRPHDCAVLLVACPGQTQTQGQTQGQTQTQGPGVGAGAESCVFPEVVTFVSLDGGGGGARPVLHVHSVVSGGSGTGDGSGDGDSTGSLSSAVAEMEVEVEEDRALIHREPGLPLPLPLPLPLYFGGSSSGRVLYSCVFLGGASSSSSGGGGPGLLAAGGEEGVVRLHSPAAGAGLPARQEVRLPGDCPVRTLSSCCGRGGAGGGRGALVAAGGRLSFALWLFDTPADTASATTTDTDRTDTDTDTTAPAPRPPPALAPVLQLGCAHEAPGTQEHRVLSSACWYAPASAPAEGEEGGEQEGYYVLLGDSRGCVRLFHYSTVHAHAHTHRHRPALVWEVPVSEYPVLCCALLPFQPPLAALAEEDSADCPASFVCFGDTSGNVYVYSIAHRQRAGGEGEEGFRLLCRYRGHSMGANAADLRLLPPETGAEAGAGAGAEAGAGRRLLVLTGGDDQALCVATLRLDAAAPPPRGATAGTGAGVEGGVEVGGLAVSRMLDVIGSAVKGVRILQHRDSSSSDSSSSRYGSSSLACVGLDQRLGVWGYAHTACTATALSPHREVPAALLAVSAARPPLPRGRGRGGQGQGQGQEGCPLQWLAGRAVHIADIGCMHISDPTPVPGAGAGAGRYCAIVGEGVELLRLVEAETYTDTAPLSI
jgi:hypothetical protein